MDKYQQEGIMDKGENKELEQISEASTEDQESTPEAKPATQNTVVKKTKKKKSAPRLFPKYSIEEARRIPDAIKQFNAGNPWGAQDVAAALKIGGKTNEYFYLTTASRDYGFTTGTRNTQIELTELGRKLVYPKSPQEEVDSIQEGFRQIELFKNVYDYYQGENLPDIQYLMNTLKTQFGVDEQFQNEFYDLYQKNLTYLKSLSSDKQLHLKQTESDTKVQGSIIIGEAHGAGKLVAFVAMPFSEKSSAYPQGYFDEVLKHLITPSAVKANFNARTAKKAGSEVIQSTIVNDLDSADLVIVDLTEHNPNVLFELGMRIAFNKPVCLIRAKGTAAIFDIDHMLRVFDYSPQLWPSTLEKDVPALAQHISETWKNKDSDRSYLNILRENK